MKLLFVVLGLAIPLSGLAVYQTIGARQAGNTLPLYSAPVKHPVRTLHQFDESIRIGMSTGEVRKLLGPPETITTRFELGPPESITGRLNLFHKREDWTYRLEGQAALLNFSDGKLGSCGY